MTWKNEVHLLYKYIIQIQTSVYIYPKIWTTRHHKIPDRYLTPTEHGNPQRNMVRPKLSEEEKERRAIERREREAERIRKRRADMTPSQRQAKRERDAEGLRKRRAEMTPAQRKERCEREAERLRKRRADMTLAQRQAERERNQARNRASREEEKMECAVLQPTEEEHGRIQEQRAEERRQRDRARYVPVTDEEKKQRAAERDDKRCREACKELDINRARHAREFFRILEDRLTTLRLREGKSVDFFKREDRIAALENSVWKSEWELTNEEIYQRDREEVVRTGSLPKHFGRLPPHVRLQAQVYVHGGTSALTPESLAQPQPTIAQRELIERRDRLMIKLSGICNTIDTMSPVGSDNYRQQLMEKLPPTRNELSFILEQLQPTFFEKF